MAMPLPLDAPMNQWHLHSYCYLQVTTFPFFAASVAMPLPLGTAMNQWLQPIWHPLTVWPGLVLRLSDTRVARFNLARSIHAMLK